MKKQKAVRTYPESYNNPNGRLNEYLNEGWLVVMTTKVETHNPSYIEYIIEKEDEPCK